MMQMFSCFRGHEKENMYGERITSVSHLNLLLLVTKEENLETTVNIF